jgi:hypothetical protein
MLGNRKLIVDAFCEVKEFTKLYQDGDFWSFAEHDIVPGAVYLISRQEFAENVKKISIDWLHFFPVAIHTYLILILRTLLLLNDERTRNQDFSYIPMVGICILLLWLIYLPARLLSLPKSDLLG